MDTVLHDLLAQRAWVQGLCRSLVADPGAADDLAQETWLSALRQRRPLLDPRNWLTAVARNHARKHHRSAGRRQAREAAAAGRADPAPSTAEVAAAFEVQRLVATAVHELREPFRTTVLLHWFEGMTLAAIAARLGEPEGTVRWRLHRAHELLRERLRGTYGDDWRRALLPLCGAAVRRSSAGAAVAAAMVLLLGIGGAWWATAATAATRTGATVTATAVPARPAAGEARAATATGGRTVLDEPAAAPTAAPKATAARPIEQAILRARLVDAAGAPLPGAQLRLEGLDTGFGKMTSPLLALLAPPATADAAGNVALALHTDARLFAELPDRMIPAPGEPWPIALAAEAPGHQPRTVHAYVVHGDDLDLGAIALPQAAQLRGVVTDQDGAPVGGARVSLFTPPLPAEDRRFDADGALPGAEAAVETAAFFGRGTFAFANAPTGPLVLVATATGYRACVRSLVAAAGTQRIEDLVLRRVEAPTAVTRWQQVVVRDETGAPLADAPVHCRTTTGTGGMGRTDAEGRVRFWVGSSIEPPRLWLCAPDPDGRREPASLTNVPHSDDPLQLRLGKGRATAIAVRSAGHAASDAWVHWQAVAPAIGEQYLRVPADGALSLVPPPFDVELRVYAAHCCDHRAGVLRPGSWPARIDVELAPLAGIRGHVRGPDGQVAKAEVLVLTAGEPQVVNGFRTGGWRGRGNWDVQTDTAGAFRIDRKEPGRLRLLVRAAGLAPAATAPFAFDPAVGVELPAIELDHGGVIQGQVLRGDGTPAARQPVACHHELFGTRKALCDAAGRFAIPALADGDYELRPCDRLGDDSTFTTSAPDAEANADPAPRDASVRRGETTKVSLQLDAATLELSVRLGDGGGNGNGNLDGGRLDGWRASLVTPHDGARLAKPVPLDASGHVALRSWRTGPHTLELRAPGGAFGDVTVRQRCDLRPGRNELVQDLVLRPWRGVLPMPAEDDSVWFRCRDDDADITCGGRFDAATGEASFALAPRGEVQVRQGSRSLGSLRLPR